jgi:hypothetical protein
MNRLRQAGESRLPFWVDDWPSSSERSTWDDKVGGSIVHEHKRAAENEG